MVLAALSLFFGAIELPSKAPDWVGAAITIAIVLGPAWVIFRSRAIKEELKLLRESRIVDREKYERDLSDLKAQLAVANSKIDALQRENAARVADLIIDRFKEEGLLQ